MTTIFVYLALPYCKEERDFFPKLIFGSINDLVRAVAERNVFTKFQENLLKIAISL